SAMRWRRWVPSRRAAARKNSARRFAAKWRTGRRSSRTQISSCPDKPMDSMPQLIPGRARLRVTPPQIVGPFYPVAACPDLAGDLARASSGAAEARGQLLYVMGRVLTCAGEAVAGARIEIWQANADGKYCHPSDVNPAPIDS